MSRRNQAFFWIALIAGTLVFLTLLKSVLLPFVAGIAVAYLFDPLADQLERAGINRALAAGLIIGIFVLAMILGAFFLYPVAARQVLSLLARIPTLIDRGRDQLLPYLQHFLEEVPGNNTAAVKQALGGSAEKAVEVLGDILSGLLNRGLALLNLLSLLIVTPIVAFYLLRDWDILVALVDSWLPRHHRDEIRAQILLIDQTLAGFVRGQGSVCLIMALYYSISLSLLGLDFGLVIGILTGFLSFIPYAGAILGFGLSVGVALVQFWPDYTLIGAVVALFAIGQFVENNVIAPKLVGEKVGLHPVWLMFSLLAFGALFGFVGVLIAVPVAAVIGVLTRYALGRYLGSRLYHGGDAANS